MNFSTTREFLCHKLHCLLYHFLVQIFYSNVDFTKDANLPDDGMDYFPFDHYWLATSQVWPPATQNRFSRGLFSTLTLNYLKVYYCSFCYCCYYYILHYFFKVCYFQTLQTYFDLIYMVSCVFQEEMPQILSKEYVFLMSSLYYAITIDAH